MKLCTACKVKKPKSDFHINRSRKDGLEYRCKQCVKDGKRTRNKRSDNGSEKWCPSCHKTKSALDFHRDSRYNDGLAKQCKVCLKSGVRLTAGPSKVERKALLENGEKYCPRCKKIKPLTAFVDNRTRSTGKSAMCRSCKNLNARKTNAPGLEARKKLLEAGLKFCQICENIKSLSEFSKHTDNTTGYYSQCRCCVSDKTRKPGGILDHQERVDSLAESGLKHCPQCGETKSLKKFGTHSKMRDGKNTHCKRCAAKRVRDSNFERFKNPDYRKRINQLARKRTKERRENDPQFRIQLKLRDQRRAARKKKLPDTMTESELDFLFRFFDGSCALCGRSADEKPLHLDHWTPLSGPSCPGTVASNMMLLCEFHNCSKGPKPPHIYKSYFTKQNGPESAKNAFENIENYFKIVKERSKS